MRDRSKATFLAVYDYGQGGIWTLIDAGSSEEIERRFPELKVVTKRPEWMTDVEFARIERSRHFDIDSATGWLLNLKQQS
jgi:hypothetical protein